MKLLRIRIKLSRKRMKLSRRRMEVSRGRIKVLRTRIQILVLETKRITVVCGKLRKEDKFLCFPHKNIIISFVSLLIPEII